MSLVKNVTGSNRWLRPSTGESSWLEYWEKQVGHKASHCGHCGDPNHNNLVGAHVQKFMVEKKSTLLLSVEAATN